MEREREREVSLFSYNPQPTATNQELARRPQDRVGQFEWDDRIFAHPYWKYGGEHCYMIYLRLIFDVTDLVNERVRGKKKKRDTTWEKREENNLGLLFLTIIIHIN